MHLLCFLFCTHIHHIRTNTPNSASTRRESDGVDANGMRLRTSQQSSGEYIRLKNHDGTKLGYSEILRQLHNLNLYEKLKYFFFASFGAQEVFKKNILYVALVTFQELIQKKYFRIMYSIISVKNFF